MQADILEEEKDEVQHWWKDAASVATARDFALLTGLLFQPDGNGCHNLPVSLQPTKFPEQLFHKAFRVQEAMNTVVDALSSDHEALSSAFKK